MLERLRAERDERRRLAELVHDGPVQHLAALGQILDAALLAFEQEDEVGGRDLVARARQIAREASVDLRDLVAGVEPLALHEEGFAQAVRDLVERVAARRGIAFETDLPAAVLLGEGARSGLYQIVREAIDQAIRRGPPVNIAVSVDADSHRRGRAPADRRRHGGAQAGGSRRAGGTRRRPERDVLLRAQGGADDDRRHAAALCRLRLTPARPVTRAPRARPSEPPAAAKRTPSGFAREESARQILAAL